MRKDTLVCLLLVAAVFAVFGQTLCHEFVNYDDDRYVTANKAVQDGFSSYGTFSKTLAWAFTSRTASNWHPLTWLSHALDCRIYGLNAWGHHLTNVLLHAATAVLLFLVLRQMTGELWPSAMAAALFALHPLRVESVAWVAERKDVLSGFFFTLTLAAYLGYVRHPFSWRRYFAVIVAFALGLMCKPMLVTLPFVLLLLDYWPLGRIRLGDEETGRLGERETGTRDEKTACGFATHYPVAVTRPSSPRLPVSRSPRLQVLLRLLLEKLPLFILSAASCAVTLWAQAGAIDKSPKVSLPMRLGNAAVSYVEYLGQFVCPMDLAVLYPHPGDSLPRWKIVVAVAVLAAVSGGVFAMRRRWPFLVVGWFWFLGMLVPVVGLVQVGNQAMADRYTYLPQIGVCIMVSWWGFSAIGLGRAKNRVDWTYFAAALAVLTVLAVCAWRQASYWKDGETLWARTIACTNNNYLAHYNLGVALALRGQTGEAIEQYNWILAAKPDYAEARYNRGVLLARLWRTDEAIREYRAVLRQIHDASDPHFSLAEALAQQGEFEEAKQEYREAIRIAPESADAYNNLGNIEWQQGQTDRAMADYMEAIRINPNYANAHNNLGALLSGQGRFAEAAACFRKVLEIEPSREDARRSLDRVLRVLEGTP